MSNMLVHRAGVMHTNASMVRERRKTGLVLCIGADSTSRGGIASVIQCYSDAHRRIPNNFRFEPIKTSYYEERGWWCEPFVFMRALAKILRHCLFDDVCLVHVHTSYKYSFVRKSICVLLCRLLGKKTILHIHASQFESFFLSENVYVHRWVGYVLRKSDLVLVLCKSWEHKLKAAFPDVRVATLTNPVRAPAQSGAARQECGSDGELTVLFMGYLIPSKGITDLVELACSLKQECLDRVKIIVAGKGKMGRWLSDTIRRQGLSGYLELRGWVDGEAKEELLLAAGAFLLPSYAEGMPMSILEAMSHGLPILSTNVGGIPEVVRHGYNGYLFSPGDVAGFLAGVRNLMRDRSLRDKMGAMSLAYAREFDKESTFVRVAQFYSQVTNNRARCYTPVSITRVNECRRKRDTAHMNVVAGVAEKNDILSSHDILSKTKSKGITGIRRGRTDRHSVGSFHGHRPQNLPPTGLVRADGSPITPKRHSGQQPISER